MNEVLFQLRSPCHRCGCESGRIVERGAQDCVYCSGCGTFCYNAPRAETGKEVRHVKTREAIPPRLRAEVLMRSGPQCELCHSQTRELHVAHMISLDAGRKMGMSEDDLNDEENLCAVCDACNLGIGKQPISLRLATQMVLARIRRRNEVMK
jgi:5-methylcytosine-specific restriction endonuclease McrA